MLFESSRAFSAEAGRVLMHARAAMHPIPFRVFFLRHLET